MYKIALVEDCQELSSIVIKYFKNEGYEITLFENGEDAMKAINSDFSLWILVKFIKVEKMICLIFFY